MFIITEREREGEREKERERERGKREREKEEEREREKERDIWSKNIQRIWLLTCGSEFDSRNFHFGNFSKSF